MITVKKISREFLSIMELCSPQVLLEIDRNTKSRKITKFSCTYFFYTQKKKKSVLIIYSSSSWAGIFAHILLFILYLSNEIFSGTTAEPDRKMRVLKVGYYEVA